MKNKILIASLILATSSIYSETFYNNNGFEVGLDGVASIGVQSKTIEIDDYKNQKSGIDEDAAFLQLNVKKKIDNLELGGHIRYGASWENDKDRNGGDFYLKYNFTDKFWAEYRKFDFGYNEILHDATYSMIIAEGKNLGTGTQMDLTPDGLTIDPVLNANETNFGVAFLGLGLGSSLSNVQFKLGDMTPDGGIWNSYMAYANNYNSYDLKPHTIDFGYKGDQGSVSAGVVYVNRDVSGNSENIEATDKGATLKGAYKLSAKSTLGAGVSYGSGEVDSSADSSDNTTTVVAENIWYKTNILGYDLITEMAHSNYSQETTSDLEKDLIGAYAKVSKFTKFGIPYVEFKAAQSEFTGTDYSTKSTNTLYEVIPGIIIPSHKIRGLMLGASGTFGTYETENSNGTLGDNIDAKQVTLSSYVTYVF